MGYQTLHTPATRKKEDCICGSLTNPPGTPCPACDGDTIVVMDEAEQGESTYARMVREAMEKSGKLG